MVKIGNVEIRGPLTLAPMAGVTDAPFRALCRAHGAALTCTEMVSAKALVYHDEKTKQLLWSPPDEHPAAAQIFGHEPEVMAEAAPMALAYSGADILDINMGCPVGKVIRSGDGSALMRDPELAGRVIEAVVKAVDVPVTVKFRKGWDGGNVNAVAFAQMCQQAGAAAVAVHGRTRVQMYAGRADWDIIRDVKRAVTIPVIANGDIFSGADAAHILRYTSADLAMIGRGSFGDPWLFARGNAAIAGEPEPPLPPLRERIEAALHQIEFAAEIKGERLACLEARKCLQAGGRARGDARRPAAHHARHPARLAGLTAERQGTMDRDEERRIIAQVCAGDTNAFEALVVAYQKQVYNLALRTVGNEEDAADMTQEVFLRAYRALGTFRGESKFSVWLYRLTTNVCIDFLRSRRRHPTVSLTASEDDDEQPQFDLPADERTSPEQQLTRSEMRRAVARGLDSLPDDARKILILRELNGLSYAEIGKVLHLEAGTVKSRLFRARRKLCDFLLADGNLPDQYASKQTKGGADR